MKQNFGGLYWWQMNEGVCHRSSTSDFSRDCMNENFEIPLKVIGHETLFSGKKFKVWNGIPI